MKTLIYLHGFLSSPQSSKAQQTRQWLQVHAPDWVFECPALSSCPAETLVQLKAMMARFDGDAPCFVGSSLGGFWATWLCETYGGKAVLVNPAVAPHERFIDYIGRPHKSYYSDITYCLTVKDLDVLAQCDCLHLKQPERYRVMLQSGDEVLDYRQAMQRYSRCEQWFEEGGDHSFVGYEAYLAKILAFFE